MTGLFSNFAVPADGLLQFGLTNFVIAGMLAGAAWLVQRTGRHPVLAHLLWLFVLLKLVTPPFVSLSLLSLPADPVPTATIALPSAVAGAAGTAPLSTQVDWSALLATVWLLGSLLVLVWSLARVVRFSRLLDAASLPAPAAVQRLVADLSRRFGIAREPQVQLTGANVSPMVWWTGGRVRVVVPEALAERLAPTELEFVLAHELGHVRRGDHFVRWLEWLVCIAFWWNPLAWWARRNLRINEEVCCDALVLATFEPNKKFYANALVTALEVLANPAIRPPAMATAINGGGLMERRIRMIVSK
ncbi:MAG: M56 family metallopeptidase, partial [Gammaproteobacteria bacterium]|nr:M56 family metallopeptidase [Gammaproteobacteria bacterium]